MSGSQFSFPLYTGSGVKLTSSGLQDEPSLTHVLIHFSSFNASSFCLMRRLKDSKTLTKTDGPSDVKLPLTNSDINICLRDTVLGHLKARKHVTYTVEKLPFLRSKS